METPEAPVDIIIPTAPVPEEVAPIDPKPSPVNNKDVEIQKPKLPEANSKKHDKSRRKDAPTTEGVLRTLSGYATADKKLYALCKMYVDVLEENRNQQSLLKQNDRRMNVLLKEKEHAQADYSKAVLTRSRLESLCRELQRQNKAIKEESLLKIKEEEEKRKEISAKFQSTLAEITTLMNDINEKNSKLKEDNTEITNKFKTVCEQYDVRVQQVEKMSNQMQLETALADAKLRKAHLEAAAERETLMKEKQELLLEIAKYQARVDELTNTESALRNQISVYTEKYEEFHSALSRSNEVFSGFKEEMDKMSKKIIKLEKETASWKHRWEKSHAALLEMAADKQIRDQEIALSSRQLTQLQKLCRTLTEERAKLMTAAQTPASGEADSAKSVENVLEENKKLHETLDSLQALIVERERLQQIERTAPAITIPPVTSSPITASPPAKSPTLSREEKKKSKKQKNRVNTAIANQNTTKGSTTPTPTPTVNGIHLPLENGGASPESLSGKRAQQSVPVTQPLDTPNSITEKVEQVPKETLVQVPNQQLEISLGPQTEVSVVPQPEISAVPQTEVSVVPQPELTAVPQTEMSAVPQPEISAMPQTEVSAVPQTEVSAVPQTEVSAVPLTEVSAVPLTEVSAVPLTEVSAVPLTEVSAVPLTEVSAVPLTEVSAVPLTEVSAVPLTEVSAVPLTEVSAVPLTEVSAVPLTDVSAVPQTEVSAIRQPEKEGPQSLKGKEAPKKKKK